MVRPDSLAGVAAWPKLGVPREEAGVNHSGGVVVFIGICLLFVLLLAMLARSYRRTTRMINRGPDDGERPDAADFSDLFQPGYRRPDGGGPRGGGPGGGGPRGGGPRGGDRA